MLKDISCFWREQPALFYALSLLIGTSAPLFVGHFAWVGVWLVYLLSQRAFPQILVLIGAVFYGLFSHMPETVEPNGEWGVFSPSSVTLHQSPFNTQIRMKGSYFINGSKVPCSLFFPKSTNRPKADKKYRIQGDLKKKGNEYFLKAKQWEAIPHTFSLGEIRYKTKERLKRYLLINLGKRASSFLSSIATGDPPDRFLRYQFGRVGLQHILAVSGFHFGIIIAFLSFLFRIFLSIKGKLGALFIASSAFYIFVGSAPSVERSYISALFYLLSQWISRPTSGLNLLGLAAFIEILFNPQIPENIGFQLSFLSCLSILLFFPIIEKLLQKLIPERKKKEVEELSLLEQHGYVLASFFRKVFSLNFAVSIPLIPLLLYHFHFFPILGLIYNLFAPLMVGGIAILTFLSIGFDFLLKPVGSMLFLITKNVTEFFLDILSHPPLAIDLSIPGNKIPLWGVCCYLCGLMTLGIFYKERQRRLSSFRKI